MKKNYFLILTIFVYGCGEPKYCNFVQVKNEKDFIGKWLRYEKAENHSTLLISECQEKDRLLDHSTGNRAGRIRWAICDNGPDCNEAGMF